MNHRPLLVEIGCEELPSSSLRSLGENLLSLVVDKLGERGLKHGASRWLASPRRLAVLIDELVEQGDDEAIELLGPPVAQAKDESGDWSKAALGFARKQGVDPAALEVINTPKGERLGLRKINPGTQTADCLREIVCDALANLPIPKRMRWGSSRQSFARPIQWVVLLYGEEFGFGEIMGIESGNRTRGHRFHAPGEIVLNSAADYEQALNAAKVIVDFTKRCEAIRRQVTEVAKGLGAHAVVEPALLEEVASLVEWPVALAGSFDSTFLELPSEALISSMQSHQKYFPVSDSDGTLRPNFITVSNIESKDPTQVIAGNERVIRPRLADADFFFKQDAKSTLESRLPKLDAVVFQKRLGTILAKTRRVQALAASLATAIGADATNAARAALLCKTDLVSDMVLEFADLQGIAGSYYATNDGEPSDVAQAIAQHYWPLQAGSPLPQSTVATAVALADRLDTLVGIFGIGQTPTGSKDPFALRRASIAVLRIIIEKSLDLDLRDCLVSASAGFDEGVLETDTADTVLEYLLDRMPALYEGQGLPVELFRAVRAVNCSQPRDFDRRLRAVQTFRQGDASEALAAANKRVSNILAKAKDGNVSDEVNTDLLQEPQEIELHEAILALSPMNADAIRNGDYAAALKRLAGLRAPVDAFFDSVMVNTDDKALRDNRLALLAALRAQFLLIADISLLA